MSNKLNKFIICFRNKMSRRKKKASKVVRLMEQKNHHLDLVEAKELTKVLLIQNGL